MSLGFIETPYRKVENGKVDLSDNGLIYLTAEEEEEKIIAQGNAPLNDDGTFVRNKVKSRQDADFPVVEPAEVDLDGRFSSADCINCGFIDSVPGT